jgi:hypothetical protein
MEISKDTSLIAVQREIQRHSFDTFVTDPFRWLKAALVSWWQVALPAASDFTLFPNSSIICSV